ncbi:hypothetical protein [Roseiconus lacunae]|uniref:hypothetical protein n=1 Tax=Roseiconus lacunae TaxID=2605694 RepID=UPI0011F0C172|nr:hypothetical protein [Roseiconus lacunae]
MSVAGETNLQRESIGRRTMFFVNQRSANSIPAAITTVIVVAICVISFGGCRLCCDREDAAFAAYGGAWQRLDRNSGRVGSLNDPAGAKVGSLESKTVDLGEEDSRSQIIPPQQGGQDRPSSSPQDEEPETIIPKFEEETDEEFQERLKRFREEQLNAQVIPGQPSPPAFR